MFFTDPVAAFVNVAAALGPGGRVRLVTWQPLVANQWLTVPAPRCSPTDRSPTVPTMQARGCSPDPRPTWSPGCSPTPARDIALRAAEVTLTLGTDPDEAAAYLAGTGPSRALLATVPDHHKPAALDAVRATLADHTDHTDVHLGAAIWITSAVIG